MNLVNGTHLINKLGYLFGDIMINEKAYNRFGDSLATVYWAITGRKPKYLAQVDEVAQRVIPKHTYCQHLYRQSTGTWDKCMKCGDVREREVYND